MMRSHKLAVMYGDIIETTYKFCDKLHSRLRYCQKRQSKRRQKNGVKLPALDFLQGLTTHNSRETMQNLYPF